MIRQRQPLKRSPLRPSLEPIPRYAEPPRATKPIRAKGGKRFPKGYDKAYRKWIRSLPCLLANNPEHVCWRSSVVAAHVHADATGVGDRGQLIPLCCNAHTDSPWSFHQLGRHSFPAHWGLGTFETLEAIARALDVKYGSGGFA